MLDEDTNYDESSMRSVSGSGLTKKLPEIPVAIGEQDRAINQLREVINNLYDRLQPVMRMTETDEGRKTPDRPESSIGLLDSIQTNTDKIINTTNGLQTILSKLEV